MKELIESFNQLTQVEKQEFIKEIFKSEDFTIRDIVYLREKSLKDKLKVSHELSEILAKSIKSRKKHPEWFKDGKFIK